MGEENPKCLFCFPLECGVMTITVLCWLFALDTTAWIQLGWIEGGYALHGVGIACYVLMGSIFIYAWIAKTEQARKAALISWIALCVVIARCWYLYNMVNGKYSEGMCTQENIDTINEAGITETFTVEDCNMYGKTQYLDLLLGWAFDIYFATVLSRWSQNLDNDTYDAQ